MSNVVITTVAGNTVITPNMVVAKLYWYEGAKVEFEDGSEVFKKESKFKEIYPVWFIEHEKDQLIAHWEKTGMFPTIVAKLRSSESAKGIM